jgi:stage V sporulation protein SpoVS
MDILSIAAASASNSASQLRAAVGVGVLKKAIDIQADGALALVQAVPTPPAAAPGEAGGTVDTWA